MVAKFVLDKNPSPSTLEKLERERKRLGVLHWLVPGSLIVGRLGVRVDYLRDTDLDARAVWWLQQEPPSFFWSIKQARISVEFVGLSYQKVRFVSTIICPLLIHGSWFGFRNFYYIYFYSAAFYASKPNNGIRATCIRDRFGCVLTILIVCIHA